MAYHYNEKTEGTSLAGSPEVAAQWLPKPPYPFTMIGQG